MKTKNKANGMLANKLQLAALEHLEDVGCLASIIKDSPSADEDMGDSCMVCLVALLPNELADELIKTVGKDLLLKHGINATLLVFDRLSTKLV